MAPSELIVLRVLLLLSVGCRTQTLVVQPPSRCFTRTSLTRAGFAHSAFTFAYESQITKSSVAEAQASSGQETATETTDRLQGHFALLWVSSSTRKCITKYNNNSIYCISRNSTVVRRSINSVVLIVLCNSIKIISS